MSHNTKFLPSLPLADWPEQDRRLWEHALDDDPLCSGGAGGASGWRPATRQSVVVNYGIWLSWLKSKNLLEVEQRPEARVTAERLRAYLADMRWVGLAEQSAATRLRGLSSALKVMAPGYDNRWISRASGRVSSAGKRVRDVHARSQDPKGFLTFAYRLMRSADDADKELIDRAMLFRDGLMLALLVHRPLRIANFSKIRIGLHLTEAGGGYTLSFEGSETKNGLPYECSVPSVLTPKLKRYLAEFRQILLEQEAQRGSSTALWIGRGGEELKPGSVAGVIRRRTTAEFGVSMGPHLPRHTIATLVAEHAPQRVRDVSVILGHGSGETAHQHYIHARAGEAVKTLDHALTTLAAMTRLGSSM